MRQTQQGRAFSLIELVVVIAILAAAAGLLLPMLSGTAATAQSQTAQFSLATLRTTIMGDGTHPGYYGDLRKLPRTMTDLFVVPTDDTTYLSVAEQTFDRNTRHGWHGPYIANSNGTFKTDVAHGFTDGAGGTVKYGTNGDPALLDPWNHPFVIQTPTLAPPAPATEPLDQFVRIVSAGPDGILQTPADKAYPTAAERGDDVVIFLRRADVTP